MSQIKLESLFNLLPMEPVLPDSGRARSQAAKAESFGTHLSRVQTHSRETSAGADPDSDRLSPPHAGSADAAGQAPAESGPGGYDDGGDSRGAGDRDRDGSAVDRASSEDASENKRTEDNETETDAEDQQSSEDAQADSQTGQTQEADNDPQAAEPEAENPHEVAGELLAEEINDKESAAAKGSDQASAAEDTDSTAESLTKKTATQGDSLLQDASEENAAGGADGAEKHTKTSDGATQQGSDGNSGKTVEQAAELIQVSAEAIATEGRNRAGQQGDGEGEMHRREESSQTQVSHAGIPLNAVSKGEDEQPADKQNGRQARRQPTSNPTGAVAPNSEADFRASANRSVTSAGEQKISAADQNINVAEAIAKPAGNAGPDGRLNASLRIASSQEARAESMEQRHKAAESDRADGTRFVRRVARAFGAIGKRGGSVRLRLSPPELGSLRLEIAVRNGLMTARVEAETPAARNLLLDNLPALRERLAQQDIRIKQFDVNLMGQSSGGLPDETANHAQSHHGSEDNDAPQLPGEADQDAKVVSHAGAANRPDEGTQLNVII